MANLNKVMLIGRLTRDPEVRSFSNGGKVAAFGFAVNNRKKNSQSGEWEDEPVFLDCEAFNRSETFKLADRIEQTLHKGQQIFIEGHLKLDQWQSKEGEKRSKLKIVVENFQYLEPRGEGGGGGYSKGGSSRSSGSSSYEDRGSYSEEPAAEPSSSRAEPDEIPF
jgi:single-strand DNA-binding protein